VQFAVGVPQEHIRSRAELVAVTEVGEAYEKGASIVAAGLQRARSDDREVVARRRRRVRRMSRL
jgi:hypothetical protein